MKNNWRTTAVAAAVCAGVLICAGAKAQSPPVSRPIVGSIDFGGAVTFDTTSLATATEVDLWNSSFVLQGSGDFSSIPFGTNATMAAPWTFDAGTPATPSPGPATADLWSVGGFVFDLTSSEVVSQTSNFLHVAGTGTVSSSNQSFVTTPGLWSFTVDNSNGQDQTSFGFQANSTAVPEAGTVSLVAIGSIALAGFTLLRRKRVQE